MSAHSTVKAWPSDTHGGTPPLELHLTALSRTAPAQQWLRPPGRFWQPLPPHWPQVEAQQTFLLAMPRAQWAVVVVCTAPDAPGLRSDQNGATTSFGTMGDGMGELSPPHGDCPGTEE